MIRIRQALLASAILAGVPALAQPAPVDLVFLHGTVLTPTGTAQALAVSGGIIVATGTDAEIAAMAPASARTVDLAGRTVMPGLYDMHVHTYFAGRDKLSCRFPQGADAKAIVAAVHMYRVLQRMDDVANACEKAANAFLPLVNR